MTSPAPNTLAVSGWAADPATPGAPVGVQVVVTGPYGRKEFDGASTGGPRPDVAAATPWAGGATGFSVDVGLPTTTGSSPQSLGCQTVSVSNLVGAVDAAEVLDDQIVVSGWAANPGNPREQVQVQLTDTGTDGTDTLRGSPAGDDGPVATAGNPDYGGDHGFATTAPLTEPGPHTLCATASSADAVAAGVTGDQQLGCQTVSVSVADDVGWLDPIRIAGGAIMVSGWAQDPSDSARHLQIQLYENTAADTQLYPAAVVDLDRPDFAAEVEADTSDHCYAAKIPMAEGVSTVCVYAAAGFSDGGETHDALLGCRAVAGALPNPAP